MFGIRDDLSYKRFDPDTPIEETVRFLFYFFPTAAEYKLRRG